MASPVLHVIGGPNGAGKSSLRRPIEERYDVVLDFDDIAKGISVDASLTRDMVAGRMRLARLASALAANQNVLLESTLAGRGLVNEIRQALNLGYEFVLWFIWLDSVELSLQRVADRVMRGGHAIVERDIVRRFPRTKQNFLRLYRPLASQWEVYDNSVPSAFPDPTSRRIAYGDKVEAIIEQADLWRRFVEGLGV